MKINKQTREQAALVCAAGASTAWPALSSYNIAWYLGLGDHVAELAWSAYLVADRSATSNREGIRLYREVHAEAEALLRTGWVP